MLTAVVALAIVSVVLPLVVLFAWRNERALFFDALMWEREQWVNERRELLNRIKPETAQYAVAGNHVPEIDIPLEDDERYMELAGMSKDELADLVAEAEMSS